MAWMIVRLISVLAVAVIASACATGTEDLRAELRTLREELRAEIRDQRDETASQLDGMRAEMQADRERLAADLRGEIAESTGRAESVRDQQAVDWEARIEEISARTEKTARNCDLSILELRKELFETKQKGEERTRRLNSLENAVGPENVAHHTSARETFVTFVEGNLVSVSLGTDSGISEGVTINIFKKDAPDKKIASAKINSIDVDSASGEIFYTVDAVAIGDRVEVAKE